MYRPWHVAFRPCALRAFALPESAFACIRRGCRARTFTSTATSYNMFDPIRIKLQHWLDRNKPLAKNKISELGHRWNDFSGYADINALKEQVEVKAERLKTLQQEKDAAKEVYIQAVSDRSVSQRRVNDLLSRKSTWRDSDLMEYTSLLHSEHSHAKAEEQSQLEYERAEDNMQRGFDDLMRSVMRRYHEEHIWSDRVRSISTYVSVGLGALNVLVFILALFIVEPYKRRRLAQTLESRLLSGEEAARHRMHATMMSVDERLADIESSVCPPPTAAGVRATDAPVASDAGAGTGRGVSASIQRARDIMKRGASFAWVSQVMHYLHICRAYMATAWANMIPFHTEQGAITHLAATTTGVMVGSVLSYVLYLALV